jgi:hypothetical protein
MHAFPSRHPFVMSHLTGGQAMSSIVLKGAGRGCDIRLTMLLPTSVTIFCCDWLIQRLQYTESLQFALEILRSPA